MADMMDFMKTLHVAATGLKAQMGRMRVITENIANVDSVATTPGGDPYRRRIVTFSSELDHSLGADVVKLGGIETDKSNFLIRHEPGNPAADAQGNVKYPNVNTLVEMTDLRDAQRSYEANLNVITATRKMLQLTIDMLKA
ncbi:MAG: flagellar basal body rod protein FlgC [Xanthobacteraceae bacterium]